MARMANDAQMLHLFNCYLELAQMQNALKKKRNTKRHMLEDLFNSMKVATLIHVQVLKKKAKTKTTNYF